ncbi:MAG: serine-type D-Ala-D-Ala carboxypeptidase [Aquificaceae bacterium]|nr:MAG: serine-type D-Ala-D-Ala carboxypeptidase [Aquificaceae bacterium]
MMFNLAKIANITALKTLTGILFLSVLLLNLSLANAEEKPIPPVLDAQSYLLVDYLSGVELAAKNPSKRIEPASITKLMTAYVLYEELEKGNITLEDRVLVSEKAWKMEGSRMFVEGGKKVPLERMLHGLIIQSGNDAAVALAEHIAGSESAFVDKMNAIAVKLGMDNTHYANASGMPDKMHYTTARDIVKLARALIKNYPEFYKLYKIKEYTYNGIKQYNRNKLLWRDKTVDGMKTGHTDSAGFCLVASAERNKMRLISVMLGTKSDKARADYSQQLLEYGFRFFETHKLYDSNSVLAEARVWKGVSDKVPTGTIDGLYVTIQKGHYDKLQGMMELFKDIDAPIQRGDLLGKAIIKDGDAVVAELPLVALEPVEAGGMWTSVTDSIKKLFSN